MELDILLINAIVYIITTLFIYKREKKINLYVVIWIAYSIVVTMGYYCVITGNHYSHDTELGKKIDIAPYIFAYFTVVLLSSPFKLIKKRKLNLSAFDKPFMAYLVRITGILLLIQTIVDGMNAYIVSSTIGVGDAYLIGHDGESINVIQDPILNKILMWLKILTSSLSVFYVIYYLNRIVLQKGGFGVNLLCASVAFLPSILSSIAGGSKGGLYFTAFGILFYYILFRDYFAKTLLKKLNITAVLISLFFIFYVILITVSRIDASSNSGVDNESVIDEISHYLGESYPNLGYYYYGHVRQHPNGKRFFPEFYSDNPENEYSSLGLDGKFDYWESKTAVPMGLFKTFWGDWYVEFGLLGSMVSIMLLFILFKFLCFNSINTIYAIPILFFYYINIVIQGCFTGSGIEGSLKHKTFLVIVGISYLMREYTRKSAKFNVRR